MPAEATQEATQVLAEFASKLKYDDIPARVRETSKNLLLDTLACAIAGDRGEETGQIAALAGQLAQSQEASVIGGEKLSLAGATVLNGFLVTAVTMCDAHTSTMTHITPEVMPPALAVAERDNVSGRDLLVALTAGMEVMTRIGIGTDYPAFRAKGWHGPGTLGPFGAATAVGRLRNFDAETMAKALGLAGSQSAGTFAAWATPTVKWHQSRGALSGLMAALLAETKFLATKEFLTAKDGGFYNTYSNGGKPDVAVADLGQRWELEQISLRLWPSASSTQAMNTALFDIVEKHAPAFDKIKKVRISLSDAVYNFHGKLPNYKGKFDALISAHYVAAAILHDRMLTLAQFEAARYDDPKMRRAAAALVECRPDPAIKGNDCEVEIEMADGAKYAAKCQHPRGSPQNPLARAQIEHKFRTYAKGVISDAAAEEVIASVSRLEDLGSVRKLMDLLRRAPAKAQAA